MPLRFHHIATWVLGISASATLAVGASMVVLADAPPCTVNGAPVSAAEAQAHPDACDAGTGPNAGGGETQPTPDPVTTEATPPPPPPDPDPAPEPDPTPDPAPDPDPTPDPAPDPDTGGDTENATTGAGDPDDDEDAEDTEDAGTDTGGGSTGGGTTDTGDDTTDTGGDTETSGGGDTGGGNTGGDHGDGGGNGGGNHGGGGHHPTTATEPTESQEAAGRTIEVKRHTFERPYRDARMFRAHYKPTGRIPEPKQLSQETIDAMAAAATTAGIDWSLIATVSWIDSRWGNAEAGGFAGAHLDDADWKQFGTDGNGDGKVDHAADADRLATVAAVLSDGYAHGGTTAAFRAYFGDTKYAKRAGLLAAYYDALGADAIVKGLEDPDVQTALAERVLDDKRITIYPGGRSDIQAGIIDPRSLVTLLFIANRHHSLTISSLVSGHNVFTTSGNISLHSYGQAMDIAVVDGKSIYGNQSGATCITVQVLKDILRLPESMQPHELISLWSLGGPSFALADHDDHIHVGFKNVTDADVTGGE